MHIVFSVDQIRAENYKIISPSYAVTFYRKPWKYSVSFSQKYYEQIITAISLITFLINWKSIKNRHSFHCSHSSLNYHFSKQYNRTLDCEHNPFLKRARNPKHSYIKTECYCTLSSAAWEEGGENRLNSEYVTLSRQTSSTVLQSIARLSS
jgi:hypothetical protein